MKQNRNFKINYEYTGYCNELKSLFANGKLYKLDELTDASKELLLMMTYMGRNYNLEYFDGIARMIGYDVTIQGIKDLKELGITITSDNVYRNLVTNDAKNKYKGMWR